MRRLFAVSFAGLLLYAPGAWAAGKAGLWSVTTVYQFGMPYVPPALVTLARQQQLKPPVSGQPFTHHICMTAEEAAGRQPLHLNSRDMDCIHRTVSAKGSRMLVESICHGPLEGVGRTSIVWTSNQHFEGSYDFKGRFRGDETRMSSSFKADWVGQDCRGVRVFVPPVN
ncbi:MAG TPA: DUF3617 domain-containing protein [Rhizomicrobium sp.]|nr:DUF3617 domain-containing protein [Rhizomicrobium sp.]